MRRSMAAGGPVHRRARVLGAALALAPAACGGRSALDASGGTPGTTGSGQPVLLASTPAGNFGVAVNATTVFWTSEDGTVRSVPIAGGAVTTLATGQTNPEGIAADAVDVYWVNAGSFDGAVTSLPVGGGAPTLIASGQARPEFITIDAANVYWTTSDGGTVLTAPIGGGAASTLATVQPGPKGIAVSGDDVYWTNWGPGSGAPGSGSVMSHSALGGLGEQPTTLASGQSYPSAIALDATNLYWLDTDENQPTSKPRVMKMARSGGAPETLAVPSTSFVSSIAVDATRVYWTQGGPHDGAVMAVPIEGGTPVTLASNQPDPLGIALDATAIYWVNNGNDTGSVMRRLK
jgi:hypothetical protein